MVHHSGLFQPWWTAVNLTADILQRLENRVVQLDGGSPLSWIAWVQAAMSKAIHPACSAILEHDTKSFTAPGCAVADLDIWPVCKQRWMNIHMEIQRGSTMSSLFISSNFSLTLKPLCVEFFMLLYTLHNYCDEIIVKIGAVCVLILGHLSIIGPLPPGWIRSWKF